MSDQRHKWKRVPNRDFDYERACERVRHTPGYRREMRRLADEDRRADTRFR